MIVATRRLIEKQKNVSELLPATESHLQSLESLENQCKTSLQATQDHVELKFATLRNALDTRREVLLRDLQEAASKYAESVTLYKRKTCDVIRKAEKVSVSYCGGCPSAAIGMLSVIHWYKPTYPVLLSSLICVHFISCPPTITVYIFNR